MARSRALDKQDAEKIMATIEYLREFTHPESTKPPGELYDFLAEDVDHVIAAIVYIVAEMRIFNGLVHNVVGIVAIDEMPPPNPISKN